MIGNVNIKKHLGAFVQSFCFVKSILITYSEYMFVALVIQYRNGMRLIKYRDSHV